VPKRGRKHPEEPPLALTDITGSGSTSGNGLSRSTGGGAASAGSDLVSSASGSIELCPAARWVTLVMDLGEVLVCFLER